MTMTLSLRSRIYRSMASRVSLVSSRWYIAVELVFVIDPLPVLPGTTAPPPILGSKAPCWDGGLGGDCAKPGNPYWCGILFWLSIFTMCAIYCNLFFSQLERSASSQSITHLCANKQIEAYKNILFSFFSHFHQHTQFISFSPDAIHSIATILFLILSISNEILANIFTGFVVINWAFLIRRYALFYLRVAFATTIKFCCCCCSWCVYVDNKTLKWIRALTSLFFRLSLRVEHTTVFVPIYIIATDNVFSLASVLLLHTKELSKISNEWSVSNMPSVYVCKFFRSTRK